MTTARKMERKGTTTDVLEKLAADAEAALSREDWPAAAAGYEALIRSRPEQPDLKFKLARAYEELGRRQDVIDILTDPSLASFPKVKQRLAKTYIKAKNYAAAMPLVEELFAAAPHNAKFREWKSLCAEKTSGDTRIDALTEQAQALTSAGRLEEAEQVYVELLAEYPGVARARFHLGQIYARQKRWSDAIPPLRAGFAVNPANFRIRKALARALFKDGQPTEAIALLDSSGDSQSDPDALLLLQRCHMKLKDWARADEAGARLLALVSPEDPRRALAVNMGQDALVELEVARADEIAESGDVQSAILRYRDVASRYPEAALAWLKLGTALAESEQNEDAIAALQQALRLSPAQETIRKALTRLIIKTWDEPQVLHYVQDAISTETADFDCHSWLARYYANSYDWPSALASAQSALAMDPQHGSTRMLAARTLMRLGRLSEALGELGTLLYHGAKRVQALQLKADIFVRLARLDDAIDLYRKALDKAPKHPMTSARLSYALLLKGDIEGFHYYHERRRELRTFVTNNKPYPYHDWNGELSIKGKLLVWTEFGFGVGQNVLHMAFLKPLVALGFDVVLEVEPRLVEICRRSFPDITVVVNDAELPAGITHQTPIGSLSRWFKPDLASFETVQPYLIPEVHSVAAHRHRLQQAAGDGQLLIGISWTSNNPFVGDMKSIQLEQLLGAIGLPGVTLVNLQYGDHSEAIALAQANTGKSLLDSGIDNSNDLDGLAAVVAAMDLVVCIGHTTAHVAGAVGTLNFVLLPAAPFPHWLAQGERCIWYPATTLFRRALIDEGWGRVLEQVGMAVCRFANAYDAKSWLAGTLLQGLRPASGKAGTLSPRQLLDAIRCFVAQGVFAQQAYRSALELIRRLPPNQVSGEVQMQRGDLLARLGDWEQARAVYRSIDSEDGSKRELEKHVLSVSLDMYDLDYALPIASNLAEEEPAYRLILANILYRLRRYEEALAELRAASLEAPQTEGLSRLVGALLLEMKDFERAEAYLTNQAAMRRRSEEYTLLGRSISAQGRREEALIAYEKAIALSKNDAAASFWRTQEQIELGLAAVVPLPPLLGEKPKVGKDDLVIFFVADNAYFWQHALVLLGSLGRRSPRTNCHVHVINPDAGVACALDIIREILPDLSLTYSFEHVDFEGTSKVHARTYYASVRFVRLAQIFAQSPASYLCLDADCIVRDDIKERASTLEIADVGIRMRYDERPHMTVAAGALLLRPTRAAAKFIDRVALLTRCTLETREAIWFLDQIVLSHVLRELGGHEVSVSQLDMTYIDWFFHDESLIWTGKGPRKFEDERYTAEVAQYQYLQENEEIARLMPKTADESVPAEA